jgi:hypothetical protein
MFDYNEYLKEQEQYIMENDDIYVYTNPHPNDKKVGDCVKRAITLSGDYNYLDVQLNLNRYKEITNAKNYNDNKNWLPYVEKVLKWKKLKGYQNIKVGEFAKMNPNGTYLVSVRKHLTTIKDGKVLDTLNCSFKAINKVWQVT